MSRFFVRLALASYAAMAIVVGGAACGGGDQPTPTQVVPPVVAQRLAIVEQPPITARSGVSMPAVVVELQAADGSSMPQQGRPITVALAEAAGSLTGTLSVTTDATGRASFSDLAIAGATGQYRLSVSSAALPSALSRNIRLEPGQPATIVIVAGDSQVAPAGARVGQPVRVRVHDAQGNAVPGTSVRFTVAAGGGSVTPSVDTTNASGEAVLSTWVLGPSVGAHSVQVLADRAVRSVAARATGLLATTVSASFATCAIVESGARRCWGSNQHAGLGDGGIEDRSRPSEPLAVPPVSRLAMAFRRSCLLTTEEELYCWGASWMGTPTSKFQYAPLRVPLAERVTELSLKEQIACVLMRSAGVMCWGANLYGEVGDGTTLPRIVPVSVAGGHRFVRLSVGAFSVCALTAQGAAFCWGSNQGGALGTGDATDRHIPWPVTGGHAFQQVAVGGEFACGLTTSGITYCWGSNGVGQLGDGTTLNRTAPSPVSGGHRFVRLSAGLNHACAIDDIGRGWCWGYVSDGALGAASATGLRPTPIDGDLRWLELSAGESNTCGVEKSGQVYCWGNNIYGQVGDGTRLTRLAPVAVLP